MEIVSKIYPLFFGVTDCVRKGFSLCRRQERWDPVLEKILSTVNAAGTERGQEAARELTRFFHQRKWEIGKSLGRGTTSRVFEVADRTGRFALKLLRFSQMKPIGPEQGEGLGIGLKHPNLLTPTRILAYDGWSVREDGKGEMVGVVMPVLGGVDLSEAMAARTYSLRETAQIGTQICRALRYLHRNGVIHCDLNLQNVRVFKDLKAVLCDLGLARRTGAKPIGDSSRGTLQYTSPQRFIGNEPFSPADDAYSFGVFLYRILYGKFPGKQMPEPKERGEAAFQGTVKKLTAWNAAERMSLAEAEKALGELLRQDLDGAVGSADDHAAR